MNPTTDEIKPMSENVYEPGLVSFMNDLIGLHKISNPDTNSWAVTMHLYVPPFKTCKVSSVYLLNVSVRLCPWAGQP